VGRPVHSAIAPGPLAVRGTPVELTALAGQTVKAIRRRGKFLLIELDRDAIACNPMLTGRFQLAAPADKLPTKTAVVLRFGSRARRPADAATWTRGASWLPADDADAEVRYRDPTQMGKVYLRPVGIDRPVPGLGEPEQGPDADDPALTVEVWRDRIRRHPGELKNLLRNQSFVAGIGNAYSDEILHAARLLPFRKRASLAAEEVDAMYAATRSTLHDAIKVLRVRVPPTFENQVRDFLAVHNKGGQACPRCGTRITEVRAGGFITSYCRGCQK
jgi:formamidopyrimidine-DNA glycosylase